jgi:hypothetical protein
MKKVSAMMVTQVFSVSIQGDATAILKSIVEEGFSSVLNSGSTALVYCTSLLR